MKLNFVYKILGSFFYTGYIPIASGTWASFLALIFYFIFGLDRLEVVLPIIVLFTVIGIIIGNKFEEVYGKDPAQCTIDEAVGMWISVLFLPKHFVLLGVTFFLWRLFDIYKPFPAGKAESIPGGLGIMLDDIISAVYVCIIMNLLNLYIIKI